jgi:hypothetical protein
VRSRYPVATEGDLERIEHLLRNYCESELAARVAALPQRSVELPFVFELKGVLVSGRLDLASRVEGRAFVLDYKTNILNGSDPGEAVEQGYRLQRLVYALACLKAGYEEVEVVYHFLERADAPAERVFSSVDTPELERELEQAIEAIERGEFPATPGEFVCSDCPVRGLVCAGMDLPDAPPRAVADAPVETV